MAAPVRDLALRLAALLAALLQALVALLERGIERLGGEPERRWEVIAEMGSGALKKAGASPEAIRARARALVERGELEKALRLYVALLQATPDDTGAMDASAEILAELGDGEGARELALRSVDLAPDTGAGKYVLLGHLEHGHAAVEAFERGLALLMRELREAEEGAADGGQAGREGRARVTEAKKRIAAVLMAIAKVYLTDCFQDVGAAAVCERLLDRALLFDSESPESCQALADLRLSQGRKGEVLALVRRTVDLCEALPDGLVPSYDFRAVTARLLVELSEYPEAERILEGLAAEDALDTEVWYLLGLSRMLLGKPAECRAALEEAKQLLEQGGAGTGNPALMEQIHDLLTRRFVPEDEKERFWNPRWWVQGDRAQAQGGAGGEDGREGGSAAEMTLNLPVLSPKHPGESFSTRSDAPLEGRIQV